MTETQRDLAEYQTDHDLLVVLNERVARLTEAVEKKADDHETRIRDLEATTGALQTSARTWRYVLSLIIGLLTLAVLGIAAFK